MAAMKTYAFFSRDKFKDIELGEYFYKVVSEDIEKTVSLLNCFCAYLYFNTPVKKLNTVHSLIEEGLNKHRREMEDKQIKVIKKQFEKDIPETSLPDLQLRYILDSIIQYIIHTLPYNGGIGFLTRLLDSVGWEDEEKIISQKDGKNIEVLIGSAQYEKQSEISKGLPEMPTQHNREDMDLILQLVKEIIQKNRGMMKIKNYEEKAMTFISLILPIERRKIVHFLTPEDRTQKGSLSENTER